jgi:hypothetical protein
MEWVSLRNAFNTVIAKSAYVGLLTLSFAAQNKTAPLKFTNTL